jgi:proteasome lid subunit RPN8/RPN11
MIMEASRDSMTKEFGAYLRAEKNVIYEIAILPGTIQGDKHTIFQTYNKPIDFSIVGSVHSHPSGVTLPSDADIHMFQNSGPIHLIVGYPFRLSDYSAYNQDGMKTDIKII